MEIEIELMTQYTKPKKEGNPTTKLFNAITLRILNICNSDGQRFRIIKGCLI